MPIILNGTTGITTPGITNTGPFTFQGVVELPAGAVGAPSLTTTGDTNTGIYFPAANQVAIATDGAQRVFVGATGDVGIGTGSPGQKLEVAGAAKLTGTNLAIVPSTTTQPAYLVNTNAGGNFFVGIDNSTGGSFGAGAYGRILYSGGAYPIAFFTNDTERMRLTSTGNLGIGTTAPSEKLNVVGIIKSSGAINSVMIENRNDAAKTWEWYAEGTGSTGFFGLYKNHNTGGTPLVVSDTGNVGIGTTSPAYKLDVNGGISLNAKSLVGTSGYFICGTNGFRWNNSTDAFNNVVMYDNGTTQFRNAISVGGVTPTTSGVGVQFPATQSASSDANTLDDYEEGTYTPTVIVNSGTPSYNYQQAYYTKIGRQVFGGGIIGVTNSNTLTGTIRISLPFTISAGSYGYTGGTVSDGSGFTFPLGNGFYTIFLQANPGDGFLTYIGLGGTASPVSYNTSGVGADWYFRFMFSYYT